MKQTILFQLTSINESPFCNKKIMDGIYNGQLYVIVLIMVVLLALSTKQNRTKLVANPNVKMLSPVPLTSASIVLGIGVGGFIDRIVLHQILQVHGMLSNKISATEYVGKGVNMFWDGIFHFFCMLVVLIGIILMWKLLFRDDIDRSGKLWGGGLLMGWGLLNIVESVIKHQILKLHNVIAFSPNHFIASFAFLGISAVMVILGYVLVKNRNEAVNIQIAGGNH